MAAAAASQYIPKPGGKVSAPGMTRCPCLRSPAPPASCFSNAVECSPDKQFRFLVSSNLYQYAGIDREVVIVGRAGQAEIWDADTYAEFEQAMLTPENLLASLEAIGL